SLTEIPDLILDHAEIIQTAYEALKRDVNCHPIGLDLLPESFTMPELQAMYETILEKKLDRRNFRRKMINSGILIDTQTQRRGNNHKSPNVYTFDKKTYQSVTGSGFNFSF